MVTAAFQQTLCHSVFVSRDFKSRKEGVDVSLPALSAKNPTRPRGDTRGNPQGIPKSRRGSGGGWEPETDREQ